MHKPTELQDKIMEAEAAPSQKKTKSSNGFKEMNCLHSTMKLQ
jgi:hypothetical protein